MTLYVIRPDNNVLDAVHMHLSRLNLKKAHDITIEPHKASRSKQQNAYMHVLFRLISKETGYTEDEVKDMIKDSLNLWVTRTRKDGTQFEALRSTAEMTTDEMSNLIDQTLVICSKLGIKYPDRRHFGYD
jgi:hypothetical protein